jgi:pyruvate,water dikinase
MDIMYPTWREDPAPVLAFVRSYLEVDEGQSPHHQQARLVRDRNDLTQEVLGQASRGRLGRWVSVPALRWILEQTQTHTRQRDTMHFELTRLFPPARRLLLELGRRLCRQGMIAQAEDIFFLEINELLELASYPRPMTEEVHLRRTEFKDSEGRPWPEIVRGGEEIYLHQQDWSNGSGSLLKGVAGSPGRVTGVARIIRGPEEFGRLQKGEVLVAPLTNPVWTPLFAIASGVITEVGGILSHGAIVAREYGIPAVMSVAGATQRLADGQQITLDGDRGVVHTDGEVLG